MGKEDFPKMPRRELQPWLRALPRGQRDQYEQFRQNNMKNEIEGFTEHFRSLSQFDCLSDEAIGYIANKLAFAGSAKYEAGYQDGEDFQKEIQRSQYNRAHQTELNRLGNIN